MYKSGTIKSILAMRHVAGVHSALIGWLVGWGMLVLERRRVGLSVPDAGFADWMGDDIQSVMATVFGSLVEPQ